MPNFLARSSAALEECIAHISECKAEGTAIESYLTQHLLVLLCADVEAALHMLIENRAAAAGDPKVAAYCLMAAKRLIRSIKKADLADLLATFDESCRKAFNQSLDERIATAYGNAVISRHKVAHSSGAQMTLPEFSTALTAAETVLTLFEQAID